MILTKKLLITCAMTFAALLAACGTATALDAHAADGRTNVIVTLALPANTAQGDQPAAIAQTTDALLAILPGGDYAVTNRYTVLPYVALSAGPQTLSVLQQSGLVAAIERDGTVSAASAPPACKTVKRAKHKRKGRKAKAARSCTPSAAVH